MGSPGSAKSASPISPAAPAEAEPADVADPGKVSELKAEQKELKKGKYGSTPAPAFKKAEAEETDTSWIEIELIDENDQPVAGERYEITTPDGKVAKGSLDSKGFARLENIKPGSCKISFPELDKDAWEPA